MLRETKALNAGGRREGYSALTAGNRGVKSHGWTFYDPANKGGRNWSFMM